MRIGIAAVTTTALVVGCSRAYAPTTLLAVADSPAVKLPAGVERQVVAVLRASEGMRKAYDSEESWTAFDQAFDPVLNKRNATTDESLAVLLSFYIGEHPHEDLVCELVARGKREVRFLTRYRDHSIDVPVGATALPTAEKRGRYDRVIARIAEGEKCRREE